MLHADKAKRTVRRIGQKQTCSETIHEGAQTTCSMQSDAKRSSSETK
jgi:hypothetical protein